MNPELTIYQEMKEAGVPISSWQSDLYVPVNDVTRAIISRYEFKSNVTMFTSNITGDLCYDIPFSYDPYWEGKLK